ncbi:hypothetical protein NKJ70_31895, partial [Mesorhizobium sp. M0092]|uniref:hypothetical protein n=1 Tax=Mesorhizobium sp. M0092 TaxID=2956876 RepID=UPI003336F2E4
RCDDRTRRMQKLLRKRRIRFRQNVKDSSSAKRVVVGTTTGDLMKPVTLPKPSDVPIADGKRHRIIRKTLKNERKATMTPSPKDVAAPGLPKPSTKFRPDWLRPILPAIALALVTTAPDPGATYNGGRKCEKFPKSLLCNPPDDGADDGADRGQG